MDAGLDHVAIAVRDLPAAIRFVTGALGATFLSAGDNEPQGFRWVQFRFPAGGKVELVTPLRDDSFLARFLERRGEGVHHVTLKVPDIARAIGDARAAGIDPVGVSTDNPTWREAFLHPSGAFGTLFQLAETPYSDEDWEKHLSEPHEPDHRHLTLEDLLPETPVEPAGS